MAKVRAALIQAHANMPKEEAIKKHEELIAEAAAKGAQITCLQEVFFGPYFCAEQDPKWYDTAERDDGPTVRRMQALAKKHKMALVVPFYEEAQTGVYYNTAVLIENDGSVLGKYRKTHIPHVGPCFWEKFYFPEPARALGLKGAELVFNPSATVKSLSRYLWELEQPAHAVANGYWIGAINRVGVEKPLNEAQFYGSSYFCDPRGRIIGKASETEDEVLVCDLDMDMNREVRNTWQFLRDRRPESYEELVRELP